MNQKGSAVLGLAVGASALMTLGTFAAYLLSGQVSREGARALASHQSEEQMRNALIYTKKLMDSGCLLEKEGAWSVAPACTDNREWKLEAANGQPVLNFSLCVSNGGPALDSSAPPSADNCRPHQVTVKLLDMVDSVRRRVNVRSVSGSFTSSATALVSNGSKDLTGIKTGLCTPSVDGEFIDFEDLPVGTTLGKDGLGRFGVHFESTSGGTFVIAGIVEQNEPNFGPDAWLSILCPGKPDKNRLCFDSDPSRGGRRILTTTEATKTREISFNITYDQPVNDLSFDLADVDGGESWNIQAFNASGASLGNVRIGTQGYGKGSGNSALTRYTVSRDTSEISKLVVTGKKSIKIFGFGLDNFRTGLKTCD